MWKIKDTESCKRTHYIALGGELALEDAMAISRGRVWNG